MRSLKEGSWKRDGLGLRVAGWAGNLASQTKDIPARKPRPAGECTDDDEGEPGKRGEAECETVLFV